MLSRPPCSVACGARLLRARGEERRVGGEGESASRVADTTPPAFALAYVGTGTLLSVLNRVGVEPPAGHVLAWLGACGVIARPGGEFVPTRG